MPLYEYRCDVCGREFELIRKFSDPPLEKCPHCGGTVHKLFSSPAIQFKGSGFYITDYAKKDQAASTPSGDSKSEPSSKDKDTGEKSANSENAEKTEKASNEAKAAKDEKSSAKADAPQAKTPAPSKDSS